MPDFIRWFDSVTAADVPIVGGKNASLATRARVVEAERMSTAVPAENFMEVYP